jgi:glycosyltransferase involved in cell wall biosynthesis
MDSELVIFGASEPPDPPNFGMPTHYMGYFRDDISLALLYSAADVMIVPSVQEAFGLTALEAMACGTPVVAFNATGLRDIVMHQQTGYLAQPYEPEDLARGIVWVLEDEARLKQLSVQARERVEREFDVRLQAQRYADLYAELLSREGV